MQLALARHGIFAGFLFSSELSDGDFSGWRCFGGIFLSLFGFFRSFLFFSLFPSFLDFFLASFFFFFLSVQIDCCCRSELLFRYLDVGERDHVAMGAPIVVFSTLAAAAQSPASRYGMTEGGEQRCRSGVGRVFPVDLQVEQGGFSQRVLVCRQGSVSVKGE